MRIAVSLDSARLFRWHLVLLGELTKAGHVATVLFRDTSEPLPTSIIAILDFDRVRLRSGADRFSVRMDRVAFAPYSSTSKSIGASDGHADIDLTIDLATSVRVIRIDGRVLRPLYNGRPHDIELFHELLDGRAPELSLVDTDRDMPWLIGLPAIEQPNRLSLSIDHVTSRLMEGILSTLRMLSDEANTVANNSDRSAATTRPKDSAKARRGTLMTAAASFMSERTSRKARRLCDRVGGNSQRWHVAWRRITNDMPIARTLSLSDYRVLPDDGQRYYADPFVFDDDGVIHVFVEEFPLATGVGVISHTVIAPDDTIATPVPVLATGQHLSYPFVFRHGNDIWMLPEQSASGGLDLYRSERFPDRWVHHARLLDGRYHDATLFEHGGLLWIAAGCDTFQSSTWDGLSLFWSTTLMGPWHPHARNPVVIDARSARPAGPLYRGEDGALYRPAQDCSTAYGGRLTLNRIVKLDCDTFAEEVSGQLSFPENSSILGPHTLSRAGALAGGIEAIDLFARPGDLRSGYRGPFRL